MHDALRDCLRLAGAKVHLDGWRALVRTTWRRRQQATTATAPTGPPSMAAPRLIAFIWSPRRLTPVRAFCAQAGVRLQMAARLLRRWPPELLALSLLMWRRFVKFKKSQVVKPSSCNSRTCSSSPRLRVHHESAHFSRVTYSGHRNLAACGRAAAGLLPPRGRVASMGVVTVTTDRTRECRG